MARSYFYFCFVVFILKWLPCNGIFLVIPEDVSTGLAGVYGFSPKFITGQDHRFGFGFRFGNHADLQVLYELGPQTLTKPLEPLRVRSAAYRQRIVRRRPLIQLLLRAGLFHEFHDVEARFACDEPR